MRDYGIVYDKVTGYYSIIFIDQGDVCWTVLDKELSKETAMMAVKGYKS